MINKILFFFILGTLGGWIIEIIFKAFTKNKMDAGMSNGPFCMLYGIGTVVLSTIISNFMNNLLLTFVLSSVILTFLEYITGVFLEEVYQIELWDYSHLRFCINKFVSIEFTIAWGILGTIFVYMVYPLLNSMFYLFFNPILSSILYFLFTYIVVDYLLSAMRLIKASKNYLVY